LKTFIVIFSQTYTFRNGQAYGLEDRLSFAADIVCVFLPRFLHFIPAGTKFVHNDTATMTRFYFDRHKDFNRIRSAYR